MINFIVCDDNKYVRELNEKIIAKIAMPYDFNYTVHSYEKYNINFKKLIHTPADVKIYILDLEMPGKSGLDIAREIRKVDWDSVIIILTSHDELELKILKEKLLILDFISKFDRPEIKLEDTLNVVLKKINSKKTISFKCNKELHQVLLDNIYYIYKDSYSGKSVIVTSKEEFYVNKSLHKLMETSDSKFYQTHRACYVNLNKIKLVDFDKNVIVFDNEKHIDYLSRNKRKELREKI